MRIICKFFSIINLRQNKNIKMGGLFVVFVDESNHLMPVRLSSIEVVTSAPCVSVWVMESRGPDYSSVPKKDPFNCLESEIHQKEENTQHISSSVKWRCPKIACCCRLYWILIFPRYIFSVLGGMGMAIIYGLKVNISVAIVAIGTSKYLPN